MLAVLSSPRPDSSSIVKPLPSNQLHYRRLNVVAGKSSPKVTERNLRLAVIGGGPAGGTTVETLAKGRVETIPIERKMDNAKPCGGAIPLCIVGEFDLPLDIIDRRVTKMKMISPDERQLPRSFLRQNLQPTTCSFFRGDHSPSRS